jgi:hypothetical protein
LISQGEQINSFEHNFQILRALYVFVGGFGANDMKKKRFTEKKIILAQYAL